MNRRLEIFSIALPRKPNGSAVCVFFAAVAGLVSSADAEVFTLSNGGQIVGQWLNREETLRTHYELQTPAGIKLKLERSQVAKVAYQRPIEEEYTAVKSQYADTAQAQWELAEWCRERNLLNQRKVHLDRVLELDPEHENARRALLYVKTDGVWMTASERMEKNGFVRYRGRWRLTQQVELMERKDKQERAEKEWFRKLKMYRGWYDDKRRETAKQKILEIDDPNAVRGLKEFLEEEQVPEVRKLYVQALGKINTVAATEVMVIRTLVDPVDEIRFTAMDHFKEKDPEIVTMYLRAIRSKDNTIINRAADGLKKLNHPAAVGALIDSLVTAHKYKVTQGAPGGGLSTTFAQPTNGAAQSAIAPGGGMGGLSGFSAGSSTKIMTVYAQNRNVLDALVTITNENYQFDVNSWKTWLAAQKSAGSALGTRRD